MGQNRRSAYVDRVGPTVGGVFDPGLNHARNTQVVALKNLDFGGTLSARHDAGPGQQGRQGPVCRSGNRVLGDAQHRGKVAGVIRTRAERRVGVGRFDADGGAKTRQFVHVGLQLVHETRGYEGQEE